MDSKFKNEIIRIFGTQTEQDMDKLLSRINLVVALTCYSDCFYNADFRDLNNILDKTCEKYEI